MTMDLVIIVLIALAAGSFANNLVSSFLHRETPDLYRSHCFCGLRLLRLADLIPILSYLFLKGRCRFCREKIPLRFLIVEVVTLILGILCYEKDGLSFLSLYEFVLLYFLLIVAITDYYEFIIPNILIIILVGLATIRFYIIAPPAFIDYIVLLAIPVILLTINKFFEIYRSKTAIGFGDIKLLMVLAILFPFPNSILGLWMSSLLAIPGFYVLRLINKRFRENEKIPFGFFISICFALLIFVGNIPGELYLKLVGYLR